MAGRRVSDEIGGERTLTQVLTTGLLHGLFPDPPGQSNVGRADLINGTLRVGEKLYDVKDGQLFEFGTKDSSKGSVGEVRTDYTVALTNEKPIALANQNNVLFQFTLGDNPEVHRLFSAQAENATPGKTGDGKLLDAKQLLVAAANAELEAAKAQSKYLRESPTLTARLAESTWFGMGDRSGSIKALQDNLETQSKLIKGNLDTAFSEGLVEGKLDGKKLTDYLQGTKKLTGAVASTATDAVELAVEGIRAQRQINEATYMGALTLAAAPAGMWVAGAAGIGRTAMALRTLGVMGGGSELSAFFRSTIGDDHEQVMRNRFSGAIESGLFVAGGIGARAVKDASTAVKAYFAVGDAVVQTSGFGVAAYTRGEKDALSWQNLAIGGSMMLAGNLIGRASTPFLRSQLYRLTKDTEMIGRMLHSSESTISALSYGGSTAVFSYAESERERIAALKGVKPEDLSKAEVLANMNWRDLPGYMASSAAMAALPVAVVSPATYRFSGHADRITERMDKFVGAVGEGPLDIGALRRKNSNSGLLERLSRNQSEQSGPHAVREQQSTSTPDASVVQSVEQVQPAVHIETSVDEATVSEATANVPIPHVVSEQAPVEPPPLSVEPTQQMQSQSEAISEPQAEAKDVTQAQRTPEIAALTDALSDATDRPLAARSQHEELKKVALHEAEAPPADGPAATPIESEQQSARPERKGKIYEEKGDLRGYIGLLKGLDAQHADLLHTLLKMVQERDAGNGAANSFRLLDGFKPKEFVEALKFLRNGEASIPPKEEMHAFVQSNSEVEAAFKLALTFGKAWPQWLRQMNSAGTNSHDATYWLPLRTVEEGRGLSEWLLRHTQSGQEDLRLAAKRWNTLTAEDRQLSCSELALKIRSEQYGKTRDLNFAAECSRWGIEPERYEHLESRFLASADVPSPLPTERTWSEGDLKGRFISRKDPRGLFLGEHTDCCQHPDGAGRDCAYYGQESVNSGFFVVEDKKGRIVAQSWAWVSENGGLCFDNVEAKVLGSRKEMVASIYAKAAKDLSAMFHTVTLGTKCSDIDVSGWQKAGTKTLRPPRDFAGYRDSEFQVVLAENPDRPKVRHDAVALKAYQEEMRLANETFQRANRLSTEKLHNILKAAKSNRESGIESAMDTRRSEKVKAAEEYRAAKEAAEKKLNEERKSIAAERDERETTAFERIYEQAKDALELKAKETRQRAEREAIEAYEAATKPAKEAYDAAMMQAKELRDSSRKSSSGRPNPMSPEERRAYSEACLKAEREFKQATDPALRTRDAALEEARVAFERSFEGIEDAVSEYSERAFAVAVKDIAPWEKSQNEAATSAYKEALIQAEKLYKARMTEIEQSYQEELGKAKQSPSAVRKQARAIYRAEMLQAYRALASARHDKRKSYRAPSNNSVDESANSQAN